MEIKIKSKKNKGGYIYADIVEHKEATSLVVFLSGFSGGKDSSLFKSASSEFFKNGFSTLRLNFCGDEDDKHQYPNMPKIWELTFSVYSAELKNILDSVGKKYGTIVLVGHSFGTPISLMFLSTYKKYISKTRLIIWDPSLLPWGKKIMSDAFTFDSVRKLYVEKRMRDPEIFNKTFYQEVAEEMNGIKVLRDLNMSTCIIGAEKGAGGDAKKYFAKLKNKKSSILTIIKGANHLFGGKRVQKELFEKTIDFLKKT